MKLSEIQTSVLREFITLQEYPVKYIAGIGSYLNDIPQLISDLNYTVIDLKKDCTPLAPFLSVLAGCNLRDSYFDDYCYFPQKRTVKSFLKKGICDSRYDIFVEDDISFEKRTFGQTIKSFIEEIGEYKFLILNAQEMGDEAVEILADLSDAHLKCTFTFCFDTIYSETFSASIKKFFDERSNFKNFLNISDESDSYFDDAENLIKYESLVDYEDFYNALRSNRLFLAVSENAKLTQFLSKHINEKDFTYEQVRSLKTEMGLACYYNNAFDEAALYFDSVNESKNNDYDGAVACLFLSKIYLKRRNATQSYKYALLVHQTYADGSNNPFYPLAVMLEYLNENLFENKGESVESYIRTMNVLKKSGYTVNYLSIGSTIPWKIATDPEWKDFISEKLDELIVIAKQIGDVPQIATCYQWKAIALSHNGENDEAMKFYNESNRLRTQMGELAPLVQIRSGLSYEALSRADYAEAYVLVNSIIKRIYELDDFSSMINAVRNIAYSLFYSRHFNISYKLFIKLVKFLQVFKITERIINVFLPSPYDILIYKTYIDIENNDLIHARINCAKIRKSEATINELDLPILNLSEAIIWLYEGNLKKSKEIFDAGINIYKNIKSSQNHRICFMEYEYALALRKLGYTEESQKYFYDGFKLAEQNKFSYYTKKKTEISLDDYLNGVEDFEKLMLNLEYLEEKIEKDQLMNQLHNRIYEYQFFNKILSFGSDKTNLKNYLNNVVRTLTDYTMAEAVYIAENKDGKWELLSYISETDEVLSDPEVWDSYMKKYGKQNQSTFVFDKENKLYFRNISKYDFVGAVILIPRSQEQAGIENLNILNISISTVQSQMVIYKQEEHLLFISTTDQLSMLKNRRALQEYIANESEKLQRYTSKRQFMLTVSVAFIDLDNFKYYNDTYGHEAGDLLIFYFSKLLKSVCRAVDFIARYGGDEFVVVMTDTNCDEGKIMASRLYEALEKAEYFVPNLEALLGKKIKLPQEKYLGFSMGICSNIDIEDKFNLSEVMMNADQALYYSKEHGKGVATSWIDVKNSIKKDN